MRVALPVAVLAMICALTFPAVRKASLSEERRTAKLESIFAPFNDANSPGIAVLVRKKGRMVFERGYGARELRSFDAIDAQTNFRLASCTKQFTAMAIMLLVHDAKLRYDESLSEVFPEFRAYGKTITIRNLLNHTNPGPIIGNITSPLFGQANQMAGNQNGEGFSENANNRRLEMQLRLAF